MFATSLFIFRRDLRLHDNSGLNNALQQSDKVIPCFIFDPRQVDEANKYKSDNALQFMLESLIDLDKALHTHGAQLYLFYGKAEDIVQQLISSKIIDAIFFNRDYTPFSIARDSAIAKICKQHDIACYQSADALLNEPQAVLKKDGSPYSVFTAFYKKSIPISINKPQKLHKGSWYSGLLEGKQNKSIFKKILVDENKQIACHGGTTQALKILKNLDALKHYHHDHDYPTIKTSHLSAHLKFGTISIRQTYHVIIDQLGRSHPLIRQLYWRDFFTHIAFHNPTIFGHAYRSKYDKLAWNYDKKLFKMWCDGKTGFPIIDAGMRELNTTGFMHNRIRMIVASFLVKDLLIDWQWGEQYFAQKLTDYDPAVNNGNWQWCASTGCDAQPYFRIFNPWLQQKKYDSECVYIKKWIPELRDYENKIIHTWFKDTSPHNKKYPRPIIKHTNAFVAFVKKQVKK